jgi:CheY-like chemotaxis protein
VSPLRILVVEDNAIIGMLLAEMLRTMGHDVCAVARTEQDGVAAALRLEPDLMVVDARLAGVGSGIVVVEAVRRVRHIPHVFMSGAPVDTGTLGGPVLDKPFRESDLVRVIAIAMAAQAA